MGLSNQPCCQERERNKVRSTTDLPSLARNALSPIEKKLKGIYATSKEKEKQQREVTTSNLVQMLIQEATDDANLVRHLQFASRCLLTLLSRQRCTPGGLHGIKFVKLVQSSNKQRIITYEHMNSNIVAYIIK